MRRLTVSLALLAAPALSVILLLTAAAPGLHAQALSASPAPAASLEDRRKALNDLFNDYWEAHLKNSPEFASSIGDKRYNDQISDYSVKAINQWLAAEQDFLMKLAAIDPTGFSDQEKTSRELLMRRFVDDQE